MTTLKYTDDSCSQCGKRMLVIEHKLNVWGLAVCGPITLGAVAAWLNQGQYLISQLCGFCRQNSPYIGLSIDQIIAAANRMNLNVHTNVPPGTTRANLAAGMANALMNLSDTRKVIVRVQVGKIQHYVAIDHKCPDGVFLYGGYDAAYPGTTFTFAYPPCQCEYAKLHW